MKTKTIVAIIMLFMALQAQAYTERNLLTRRANQQQLKEMLVQQQQWVKYPAYTDRSGWDRMLGDWKEAYIACGEKRLNYAWKVVKATDYLEYERSGSRTIMEDPYFENNRAIAELMMAELAEGKGRFVDQLINGVFHTCEMTSWALSAHLTSQYSHRSLPETGENIIALFSCQTGAMMSWIYYFFHDTFDKVNPEISHRLQTEIQRRILNPYMNENRFWWMGFKDSGKSSLNNWTPWCNFSVLQCFTLIEQDPDKLAAAVYRTMQSVDKYLNSIQSDGACDEGPSYWGVAAGKLYDYLQLLSDATGGKLSLFDEPMVKNMGEYISRVYVGNGWVVNFADASPKIGGDDAALIYRFGKAVNSREMMDEAALLQVNSETVEDPVSEDVSRTLQSCFYRINGAEPKHVTPECTWYPETQVAIMKDKCGLFLAAKGGNNNESHNHNDVGSFVLYANELPVFIDAGVGTYTRQTFSSERYQIWTMQSDYHNLPQINGVQEKAGAEYKASDIRFEATKKLFAMDLAKAYPKEAMVRSWKRTYQLRDGQLKIADQFALDKALKANEIHFLVTGETDASTPGIVTIKVGGRTMKLLYDKRQLAASLQTIQLDDKKLSRVWGDKLCRITLMAKAATTTGSYNYTLVP